MSKNLKIKFNIEITDESGNEESNPIEVDLSSVLSMEDASNIDKVENKLLELDKEAIRKVLAKHLENISKKKQYKDNFPKEEILNKMLRNIESKEK